MKRHARKAFTELKNKGVHVLSPDLEWGGHFAIGAECWGDGRIGDRPDRLLDYYEDYFGDRTIIPAILQKHGLFFEWINAGVVGVYDA